MKLVNDMKMRSSLGGLKPQDILLLLKLVATDGKKLTQAQLAKQIGISPAEASYSLRRLIRSRLVNESELRIFPLASREFLVHGVKYIFPAQIGSFQRGVATARSAKPLKGRLIVSEQNEVVWPDARGKEKGMALEPIYETVPMACKLDPALYELMALVDSLRVGRARELNMARAELEKRILKESVKRN